MLLSLVLRTDDDFVRMGIAWGIVALLLTPFLISWIHIGEPLLTVSVSVKNKLRIPMDVFLLSPLPIGVGVLAFTFIGYINRNDWLAGLGPTLLIASIGFLVKLLINWRRLQQIIRIWVFVELAVLLGALVGMLAMI